MADLITHTCVAVLYKVARGRPLPQAGVPTFLAGTFFPDILGRVPAMLISRARWDFPQIPEPLCYVWTPLHLPMGMLVAAYLLAFAFAPDQRVHAFRNLLGGALLHLAVDLLQSHMGVGYLIFFPFSRWDFEFGWIGSETTVLIVPLLLPLTLLLSWVRWRKATSPPTT